MDVEIVGRHALLFDDDANCAFVNSADALVPWSGNPSLLIDRHDVRHLLEQILPPRKLARQHHIEADGISLSELDAERYRDLPNDDGDDEKSAASDTNRGAEVAGSGTYQAVPFSYANNDGSRDQKNSNVDQDYSGYHPPFPLPQSLLSNLPPTEKLHQIIARTATFVSKHGGQSEIVLRVKQGNNPTFGFLMPDHHLHSYFQFLVDHPELLNDANTFADGQEEKNKVNNGESKSQVDAGGALSLLGSIYGSGEDDEGAVPASSDSKEMESGNSADGFTAAVSQEPEKGPSTTHSGVEVKTNLKPIVTKEKSLTLRKNLPVVTVPSETAHSKSRAGTSLDASQNNLQPSIFNSEKLISEPPSSLKPAIEKIVEFILRNGKEFEAVLIKQDKAHGRFPFLLPTNLYHSYYLKALKEAHEEKIQGRKAADYEHDSSKAESSRKNRKGSSPSLQEPGSQIEGLYDVERKEKFKMVIGSSKKDAREPSPKHEKEPGVSAEAAAAIVMAATRGLSSPTKLEVPAKRSGLSAAAAAAIVMEATRGSRSPTKSDVPSRLSEVDLGRAMASGDGVRSSSLGSLSGLLYPRNSFSKPDSAGNLGTSAGLVGSTAKLGGEGCSKTQDVIVANVIAKTAAIAAASEADSSEACLTKEQKQKAERLKRAKMFAAMIKSSGDSKSKLLPSAIKPIESQLAPSCSMHSGPASDLTRREREGSSLPVDAGTSGMVQQSDDKDSSYQRGEYMSRKHSSRSGRDHYEDPEECGPLRKKHRSEDSSHLGKDDCKHKKRHSSKHHSSSEDESYHRKKSKSRHRHRRHHSSSDDEHHHHRSSHRHRRKSHSERQEESEDKVELTILEQAKEAIPKIQIEVQEAATPSVSDAPRSDAMEVSDELRAKVRAMLATM